MALLLPLAARLSIARGQLEGEGGVLGGEGVVCAQQGGGGLCHEGVGGGAGEHVVPVVGSV
jgi:hypothetical protein